MRFLAVRAIGRFGPLRALTPVRTAIDTFVLGRLFARYLSSRSEPKPRIEEEEAAGVRRVIDGALLRSLTAQVDADTDALAVPPEDFRDDVTQAVDGALIATAGLPAWIVRHLDAAFDDLLAHR